VWRSAVATSLSILASLGLGACVGGSGGKANAGHSPEDTAIAKRSLLVGADLPAGWTGSPSAETPARRQCPSTRRARAAASARATSPDFALRPTAEASNTVYVFADIARARKAMLDLSSHGTYDCLSSREFDALDEQKGKGTKLGDVILTDRPLDPVGEQRHIDHVTILYSTPADRLAVGTDFVFIRQGRGISALVMLDKRSSSFDEGLRNRLAATAARKLEAALAAT